MGQSIANTPYSPYTGQLVANTPSDTLQAYQQIRDMQGMTNPAFSAAQNAWSPLLSNLQSLTPDQQNALTNSLYTNFGQQVMSPAMQVAGQSTANPQGLRGGYLGNAPPATAQQVVANQYALMSPYEQAVLQPALTIGQQQLMGNLQNIGAAANQAGAFGG